MWAIKAALFIIGGLIGGLIFLALGEMVYPNATVAAPPINQQATEMPVTQPANPPSVTPISPTTSESGINAPNNSGIVTQGQTGNNTLINQVPAPRRLSPEQAEILTQSLRGSGISVLITSPSDPEALAYQQQMLLALQSAGVKTSVFNIGNLSPPPYGIEIRPNGHSPEKLLIALRNAKIPAEVVDVPPFIPATVQKNYVDYISLIVGFRK